MTRNYSKVSDELRQQLISMVNQNMTIKDAARLVDIKYENAKAIYRVYRKEQRTSKRRNRFRYKLPLNSSSKLLKGKTMKVKPQGDDEDELASDSEDNEERAMN